MSEEPERSSAHAERRVSARQPVQHLAAMLGPAQVPGAFYGQAWVTDVSAGGVGLRARYLLAPGTVVRLDVFSPLLPNTPRVRVVYATALAGDSWRAGCAFDPPPVRTPTPDDATRAGPRPAGR